VNDSSASSVRVIRFGGFELDLHAGELRKAGARLSLPAQSFHVLALLLERPGDLVTREELRQRLWPTGTFVDFEHGLNAVVNRLRDTLGDSADRPRFIETVPRRGYRFVGSVEAAPVALEPSPPPAAGLGRTAASVSSVRHLKVATAVAALLGLGVGAWLFWRAPSASMLPPKVVGLTSLAGIEDWPTFSPDGQQVAFGWEGEKHDNADIYLTLVGSQAVRRVTTDPAADYAPSWSPDGRHIAFLRTTGSGAYIHLTSALGGPDLKVSDFPVANASRITWSPDGQYIAAGRDPRTSVGTSAGIYLIPVRGGEARAVTRPAHPTFDFSPAFSPDARRLAYASCAKFDLFAPVYYPMKCHVRVVDLDTNLRQAGAARILTPSSKDHLPFGSRTLDPSWTRDGKSVMFAGEVGPDVHIWRVWIGGERAPERIELAGSQALHPAMAASQDRLVFSRYDWDDHLYQFIKGLPAEQIAPSSSFETDPHFSPDGRRIAFASGRSGHVTIWVADADGSGAYELMRNTSQWQGSPRWSPDGRSIAFDAAAPGASVHIWTIDAEGGTPRQITTHPGNQSVPTWSHDGKWIYYSADRGSGRDLWRVSVGGGAAEQLTRTGSGFLGVESADGKSVVYQPTNADSPLLLLPLNGGQPRQLVGCVRSAAFAMAGRTLVYVACEPGTNPALHKVDTVSGQDRVLGRLEKFKPGAIHVNLAVSPDGKTILFKGTTRNEADLVMIENFR